MANAEGKALFYFVEPALKKHYDNMERRDPLSQAYSMDKPSYEYAADDAGKAEE